MDRAQFVAQPQPLDLPAWRDGGAPLAVLRQQLGALGYDEPGLVRALQRDDPRSLTADALPVLEQARLDPARPLDLLVKLFFANLVEQQAVCAATLGAGLVEQLLALGLLEPAGEGRLRATLSLEPLDSQHILTDLRFEHDPAAAAHGGRVMYLGVDSLQLARLAADRHGQRALELCCGSAAAALQACAHHAQVVAVDLNPRAVQLARCNALLNGVDNLQVLQGDLWQPVAGQRFDTVLANPPFVPTGAAPALLFRDGGPAGDAVLRRILAGLGAFLAPGGSAWITTDLVEIGAHDARVQVQDALGAGAPLAAAIFATPARDPAAYAVEHHLREGAGRVDAASLGAWLDGYRRADIRGIRYALLALLHRPGRAPRVQLVECTEPLDTRAPLDGLSAALLQRLAGLGDGPPPLALTASLGEVSLQSGQALAPGLRLPFPLASAILALGEQGVDAAALVAWLEAAGFALGDDGAQQLAELLERLWLAGYLEDAGATASSS